jgi:hypothetical protein
MVEKNENNNPEKLGPKPLLRDVLAELTFKPGRWLPDNIDKIDLGVFQDEAIQLANDCFLDPEYTMSGKMVFVTGQKKVLISNHVYHANPETNTMWVMGYVPVVEKEIAEKEKLNLKYFSTVIHSFNNRNNIFSPSDLMLLLLKDFYPCSASAGFIVGKTNNSIFFRGENAPQLEMEELEKKADLWIWQLRERVGRFIDPEMTEEEKLRTQNRAERALVRQICTKYDIKYFSGSTSEAIVTKQTL